MALTLQRHFSVLTKCAHVESRFFGRRRQGKVVFYASVNLCDRRACSVSVAVGIIVRQTYRSSLKKCDSIGVLALVTMVIAEQARRVE